MRYHGQNYENQIPLGGEKIDDGSLARLYEAFEADYRSRYGYALAGEVIELVSATVTAEIEPTDELTLPAAAGGARAASGDREVTFRGGAERAGVVTSEELRVDEVVTGPAVIVDDTTTTLLSPGDRATVCAGGVLVIEIAGSRETARVCDAKHQPGVAAGGRPGRW